MYYCSVDRVRTDVSMQPHPVQDRLLQRCVSWRHPETAAPERSWDCAAVVEAIPCQAVAAPAALAASSVADNNTSWQF